MTREGDGSPYWCWGRVEQQRREAFKASPPVIERIWCPGKFAVDVLGYRGECEYCGTQVGLTSMDPRSIRIRRHKMPPYDTHEADDGQ